MRLVLVAAAIVIAIVDTVVAAVVAVVVAVVAVVAVFPQISKHTTNSLHVVLKILSKRGHYMPQTHTMHYHVREIRKKYHTFASSLIFPAQKWVHPRS